MADKLDTDESRCGIASAVDWSNSHLAYWNRIADEYDGFYTGKWSQLENQLVRRKLEWIRLIDGCRILDLGCGTGLGYELCTSISDNLDYTGLDLSPRMVDIARSKYPLVDFRSGRMNDLSFLDKDSYDLVISLFGAFSYEHDARGTIENMRRVLKVEGRIFIAAFGQFALRRLLRLHFGTTDIYATRNMPIRKAVPVSTYSVKGFEGLFAERGFTNIETTGMGFLSGVFENRRLWLLDRLLSTLLPNMTHLLLIEAKKP